MADDARRCQSAFWHTHVATLLRDAMPDPYGATPSEAVSRNRPIELDVPVFRVATRVGTLPNVRRALREAQASLPADRLPLAVIRDESYQTEFVAMPLDKFLLLVSAWWAATQPGPSACSVNGDTP